MITEGGCHMPEYLPHFHEDQRGCLFPEEPVPLPPEPNLPTQARWRDRKAAVCKYVDDAMITDCICLENTERYEDEDLAAREKRAVQMQNPFQRIKQRATFKGMKVNTGKTKMLCVLDALLYLPGS